MLNSTNWTGNASKTFMVSKNMLCALHSNITLVHICLEMCVTQISIVLNFGLSPQALAKRSLVV